MTVTDIRHDLRLAMRDVLAAHADRDARRRYVDGHGAHDGALWQLLATQVGVQGIGIDEHYGGAGASLAELSVVMEETGAALLCAPLLASTIMATTAIRLSDDAGAAQDLLPPLADGSLIATLAYRVSTEDPVNATLSAYGCSDVSGTALTVIDGMAADTVLVVADTRTGPALLAVDTTQVERQELPVLDPTRRLAHVTFRGAAGRLLGQPGAGQRIVSATADVTRLMLAAEQVGGAQRCLDMTIEYARAREQFGRPIGSFQAIKHRVADMYVAVQSARAATEETITAHLRNPRNATPLVHATAALASDAFSFAAKSALQVFGGIGYTWEHDAHLYLKRALSSARLLGTPTEHRNAVARHLGL